jgi:hypothetical protein
MTIRQIAIVACILGVLRSLIVAAAPPISGVWWLHMDFDDHNIPGGDGECTFKQDHDRLAGTCIGATLTGEVKGHSASWEMRTDSSQDVITFTGTVNDEATLITGTFSRGGMKGQFLAVKN